MTALMAFEVLDKSVDDDSDSEGEWDDAAGTFALRRESAGLRETQEAFDRLHLRTANVGVKVPTPVMPSNGKGRAGYADEEEEEEDVEDENDPFADRNEVHTPKAERPGMTW